MPRQSALVGRFAPIFDSLVLSREDVASIVQHVSSILSAVDILVLFVFGWLLVPYTRIIYSFLFRVRTKPNKECGSDSEKPGGEEGTRSQKNGYNEFENSVLYFIIDHLSQIARLAVLVYVCDCLVIALEALGYQVEYASKVFAKILYTR